jgi:HEAT repeat protein
MALGEFGKENEAWAARNLIACDPSEASKLLASTNPEALVDAINAMEGQPIDDKLMILLKKCLEYKNDQALQVHHEQQVRRRAALIMAAGTSGKLANEAVEAIGEALTAVADIPGVDGPPPFGHHGTESTWGEFYHQDYIGALAIAHVEDRAIHDFAKRLQGRAKDAAILALARRGNKSVRKEIVRLAQDAQAGLFRAWAATALGEIGTQDDLPFLRTLADNDPLTRK